MILIERTLMTLKGRALLPPTASIDWTGGGKAWRNGVKLSLHWCKIAAWRGQGSR